MEKNGNESAVRSYQDVAQHFDVSVETVREWKERGAPIRPPGPFDLSEIEEWVRVNKVAESSTDDSSSNGSPHADVRASATEPTSGERREAGQAVAQGSDREGVAGRSDRRAEVLFPQAILNVGYIAGLSFAGLSLLMTGIYLLVFLISTDDSLERLFGTTGELQLEPVTLRLAVTARIMLVKMVLLSCGVFVALAFGFLGFSLFLVGIRGEMDAEASNENMRVKLSRMYPGVFVILCATVLIGICVTRQQDLTYDILRAEVGALEDEDNASGDSSKSAPGRESEAEPQDAEDTDSQDATKDLMQQYANGGDDKS